MIIQCDACQTRFKLADERLKPQGVKVRCTRCETIFHVPGPEARTATPAAEKPTAPAAEKPGPDTLDFSDIPVGRSDEEQPAVEEKFDFDEFNMEDLDAEPGTGLAEAGAAGSQPVREIGSELPDFQLPEDFSFDDESDPSAPLADFSPEDLTREEAADEGTGENPVGPAAVEFSAEDLSAEPPAEFSFDNEEEHSIGGDLGQTFELGNDLGDLPELGERPEPPVEDFGTGVNDEFSFTEEPAPSLIPDETGAGEAELGELPFDAGAVGSTGLVTEADGPAAEDFVFEQEPVEPPPSSEPQPTAKAPTPAVEPAPRPSKPRQGARKRSTARVKKRRKNRHTGLLLMLLLIALLAGGYTYLAQLKGSWDPHVLLRYLQQLTVSSQAEDPVANIKLLNLRSSFVSNQNAGQLFAISGEVRNNYDHNRSAISVKGIIYDAKGKPVMQQIAFCGNPLDEAALRTLPFAKIEETMNNQFGDSLSNLDVAPGTTVPFTIVFKNLPEQVAEFNVEVADSRPGAR